MIQTYLETEHLKHPELTPEDLAAIGTSMRSLRIPRRLVPLLLLGLVAAVAAEVVALVALTLSDPSDALAVIVLVGCGALLFALLVGIGDAVVREFRAKPPELSKTPPGGPD